MKTAMLYDKILGHVIPFQDFQSDGTSFCQSWNGSEILGVTLAAFIITNGANGREMILACAKIGRDADTIARAAGVLIGAYQGITAIPEEWVNFVSAQNRWLRLPEKAEKLTAIVRMTLKHDITAMQSVLKASPEKPRKVR